VSESLRFLGFLLYLAIWLVEKRQQGLKLVLNPCEQYIHV